MTTSSILPAAQLVADLELPGTLDELKQRRLVELHTVKEIERSLTEKPGAQINDSVYNGGGDSPYRFDPLFGLNDLVDVWHMMYPDTKLYPWQAEELLRMSGYIDGRRSGPRLHWTPDSPFLSAYVCANSSGKDMVLIATVAIGLPLLYRNVIVVITSSSHVQLKQQTQNHIERGIKALNGRAGTKIFHSVEFCHTCPERGGEIHMFATDEPGRAEGWHPRTKDGRLVVIKNEAKSIPEEIHTAMDRCHGYSHWLEISSPGPRSGKLYRNFRLADKYPARPQPYQWWARKVDWTQCPHLSPKLFELKVNEYADRGGVNSYFIQTSFLANFYEQEEDTLVPYGLLLALEDRRFRPDPRDIGIGLDSSGGGDETCMYVRFGPSIVRKMFFRQSNTNKAVQDLHGHIADLQSQPYAFDLDDGGISRTFSDGLVRLKWQVRRRLNQSKSSLPSKFVNLGAQMWWKTRTLLERQQIEAPEDEKTRIQLATRRYDETESLGKISLMSKKDMKSQGIESPDRADAWVLCFNSYTPDRFSRPSLESDPDPALSRYMTAAEFLSRANNDPAFLNKVLSAVPKTIKQAYTQLNIKSIQ